MSRKMRDESWRQLIGEALEGNGESWADVVGQTPTDADLDKEFDAGFGSPEGCAFTLWTRENVYFPICYDGAESVGSAPRNPCDKALSHQGGW